MTKFSKILPPKFLPPKLRSIKTKRKYFNTEGHFFFYLDLFSVEAELLLLLKPRTMNNGLRADSQIFLVKILDKNSTKIISDY